MKGNMKLTCRSPVSRRRFIRRPGHYNGSSLFQFITPSPPQPPLAWIILLLPAVSIFRLPLLNPKVGHFSFRTITPLFCHLLKFKKCISRCVRAPRGLLPFIKCQDLDIKNYLVLWQVGNESKRWLPFLKSKLMPKNHDSRIINYFPLT